MSLAELQILFLESHDVNPNNILSLQLSRVGLWSWQAYMQMTEASYSHTPVLCERLELK